MATTVSAWKCGVLVENLIKNIIVFLYLIRNDLKCRCLNMAQETDEINLTPQELQVLSELDR